jgi:phosphoenolpyruvate carboxykinase (ATP)
MLACDAFGVLPPISRLTPEQATYHFLSGYTAKVAGTERGLGKEPQVTFSTCFGAPFLPIPPAVYARLFREKVTRHKPTCWLVNTGWTGGPFGVGHRIEIAHSRALLHAAMSGHLDEVPTYQEPFFGLTVPTICPGVPDSILYPQKTWADPKAYEATARDLAGRFRENFTKYAANVEPEVLAAEPK